MTTQDIESNSEPIELNTLDQSSEAVRTEEPKRFEVKYNRYVVNLFAFHILAIVTNIINDVYSFFELYFFWSFKLFAIFGEISIVLSPTVAVDYINQVRLVSGYFLVFYILVFGLLMLVLLLGFVKFSKMYLAVLMVFKTNSIGFIR